MWMWMMLMITDDAENEDKTTTAVTIRMAYDDDDDDDDDNYNDHGEQTANKKTTENIKQLLINNNKTNVSYTHSTPLTTTVQFF